jgi:hypothetical protein
LPAPAEKFRREQEAIGCAEVAGNRLQLGLHRDDLPFGFHHPQLCPSGVGQKLSDEQVVNKSPTMSSDDLDSKSAKLAKWALILAPVVLVAIFAAPYVRRLTISKETMGSIGGLIFICVAASIGGILYFLPTIIASTNKNRHAAAIGILNLFLGWTLLGWVGSLVWSCMDQPRPEAPKP